MKWLASLHKILDLVGGFSGATEVGLVADIAVNT